MCCDLRPPSGRGSRGDDISTFDFLAMMISMIPSIGTLSKICELSTGLYWRGTIVNFWHVKVH